MGAEQFRQYILDNVDVYSINGADLRLRECPYCGEPRTMKINLDKFKFFCLHRRCMEGGGSRKMVEMIEGCDSNTARELLSSMLAGMSRPTKTLDEIEEDIRQVRKPKKVVETSPDAVALPGAFVSCWKEGRGWRVPKYLTTRGLSKEALKKWGIGFCEIGEYAGRLVIPIRNNGVIVGWIARKMSDKVSGPKYRVADGINTSHMLFGYDEIESGADTVAAVEGSFDAIKWNGYGIPTAAYLKDRLSENQVIMLIKKRVKNLVLVPDGVDKKAVARAMKDADRYRSRFESVSVAVQADGRDPDELTEEEAKALLASASAMGILDAIALEISSL